MADKLDKHTLSHDAKAGEWVLNKDGSARGRF